jgi:hypothetical protein
MFPRYESCLYTVHLSCLLISVVVLRIHEMWILPWVVGCGDSPLVLGPSQKLRKKGSLVIHSYGHRFTCVVDAVHCRQARISVGGLDIRAGMHFTRSPASLRAALSPRVVDRFTPFQAARSPSCAFRCSPRRPIFLPWSLSRVQGHEEHSKHKGPLQSSQGWQLRGVKPWTCGKNRGGKKPLIFLVL